MEFVVAQLLNGLVYGMLLFLMAAGLSLIFGLMNVVSLAHGSFFMLSAFFGLSIYQFTGIFWLALLLAPIPVAAIRIVMELVFMRPLYRRGHMDPGAADLRLHLRVLRPGAGGVGPRDRAAAGAGDPPGATQIGLGVFSTYRLFLIGLGFAMALLLWLFLDRSRIGAMVRAGVDDAAMAAGSAPISAPLHRHLRRRRGAGRARRRRGRPRARALSRHGYRNSHPRLHRHRHRRDGKPARRLRRQPADRRDRHVRQGLFRACALFLIYLVMAVVLLVRPQGLFGIKYTGVSAAPAVTTVSTPATTQTPRSACSRSW
jgi:branched-subunit amino acid ABC-type transport system permease component